MLRSKEILKKTEFAYNRSVYKSMGFTEEEVDKPLIGIANSWNELVPGHYNLRSVAEAVKRGIYTAGGTAVEFGVIGACDGSANGGTFGMHFILPSRELIANDIEVMAEAHQLDALVLLGSCDKIVPGMLMAAARLNIPCILVPGGPMLGGICFDGRPSDITSCSEAFGMFSAGKIDRETVDDLEDLSGPTCGSCSFLGTANTMCCLAEAMGMTLPTAALIPAVYAERTRIAVKTGEKIVELVRKNIKARDIITLSSLKNAAVVLNAIGGSTNGVLHLSAIAHELGIAPEVMTEIYDKAGRETPQIVKVNPASKYNMEDFYFSGGIPQVMKELSDYIDASCMTASGSTVSENLSRFKNRYPRNFDVIRKISEPFDSSGGIALLRGNLAPDGCVTKPAAIDPSMRKFTGEARVFDREEDAEDAIIRGEIKSGHVVVIRYEGPKGGPGMREMYKAMKYIYGRGLALSTALITDGRFSGTNNGCFVGHISPEAAEGGPLACVKDGDMITIDIPNRSITLHVDEAEMQSRMENVKMPEPKFKTGYLSIYSKLARSADKGAIVTLD